VLKIENCRQTAKSALNKLMANVGFMFNSNSIVTVVQGAQEKVRNTLTTFPAMVDQFAQYGEF
jgi:hypothetical protein